MQAHLEKLAGYSKTYTTIGSITFELISGQTAASILTFMNATYAAYVAAYTTSPIDLQAFVEYVFNAMITLESSLDSSCYDTKSIYIKAKNNSTGETAYIEYKH